MKWVMRLLALFIIIPLVELIILLEIGKRIGTMNTIMLIIVTGVVGTLLVRSQGLAVLRAIQREVQSGGFPASALADGLMILVAGALLITPGVMTDIVGLSLLLAPVREWIKRWSVPAIVRLMTKGSYSTRTYVSGSDPW